LKANVAVMIRSNVIITPKTITLFDNFSPSHIHGQLIDMFFHSLLLTRKLGMFPEKLIIP